MRSTNTPPPRPKPNVTRSQKEPSEEQRTAQKNVQLTAFGVILLAILVINIIFWVSLSYK